MNSSIKKIAIGILIITIILITFIILLSIWDIIKRVPQKQIPASKPHRAPETTVKKKPAGKYYMILRHEFEWQITTSHFCQCCFWLSLVTCANN